MEPCRRFCLKRLETLVYTVPVMMLGPEDMLTKQARAQRALCHAGTSLRLARREALAHDVPAALLRSGKMTLLMMALRALSPRAGSLRERTHRAQQMHRGPLQRSHLYGYGVARHTVPRNTTRPPAANASSDAQAFAVAPWDMFVVDALLKSCWRCCSNVCCVYAML